MPVTRSRSAGPPGVHTPGRAVGRPRRQPATRTVTVLAPGVCQSHAGLDIVQVRHFEGCVQVHRRDVVTHRAIRELRVRVPGPASRPQLDTPNLPVSPPPGRPSRYLGGTSSLGLTGRLLSTSTSIVLESKIKTPAPRTSHAGSRKLEPTQASSASHSLPQPAPTGSEVPFPLPSGRVAGTRTMP